MDNIIFLDKDQQSVLSSMDRNSTIKHLAIKGPPGSGKTIIGLKCANRLVKRYLSQGAPQIFIYGIAYNNYFFGARTKELISVFEKNIKKDNERVNSNFGTLSQICELMNVKRSLNETAKDSIERLCQAIRSKHSDYPCIVLVDECSADEYYDQNADWTNLQLPGTKSQTPQSTEGDFHLVLCVSPIRNWITLD